MAVLKTSSTRPAFAIVIATATTLLALVSAVVVVRAFMGSGAALAARRVPPPSPPAPLEPTREAGPPADRTPEIRGRILDADGNLVQGASVRLVSASLPWTVLRETKSDAAGAFFFASLARVESARVRVVADHDPGGAVTSAPLHVDAGQTTEITLVLSAASAVRGTVVDAEDHAIGGAVLSVEGVPWVVGPATSDGAGAFRLPAVPEGATFLVATARGYKTARVALGQWDAHRDEPVELVVRVRLAAAPPVDGDVRDTDDKPARARVIACEGLPGEARTVSADDGTFQLPPSTVGCDAIAQHDEYAPSDAIAVVEGRRALLRLKPGGSIDGVVVDERGAAVTSFNVGIESFSAAHGRSFRSVRGRPIADPRGAFLWDKLAPGSYVLTAAAPGKPPARSGSIDVLAGAVTRGVRIVLGLGGAVTGHVYDDGHAPLADVDVHFDAVSSVVDGSPGVKTDRAGQYRLDGAPDGPFTLFVKKDGFRVRLLSGLRVDSHRTLTEDVTLTAVDGGPGIEFGGIGASLAQSGDGISLSSVFAGDPAERLGLRAGDRIVRIDGEDIDGLSIADVLQRIRGEPGTSVGVSVLRPKTGETVEVTIARGNIVR